MSCRKRKCCCGGCSDKPNDGRISTSVIQPMQQYCVDCLPVLICVTYDNGVDPPHSRTMRSVCSPAPAGEDPIIYTGIIPTDSGDVTLKFRYVISDGACMICLDGADACLPVIVANPPNCYDVMGYSFDYGGATITTSTADNLSIMDDVYCNTCNCICRCICFYVNGTVEVVCGVVGDSIISWERSDGYIIYMGNYGICTTCKLSLDDPNGYDTGPDIEITGERASSKACPDPLGSWEYTDDAGNLIRVVFDCSYCDDCKGVVTSCCDRAISRVLIATVDLDCATGCGDFSMELFNGTTGAIWEGNVDLIFCGHHCQLSLSCSTPWALTGDYSLSATLTSETCSPFRLEYDVTFAFLGVCNDLAASATGTIIITEP